jgi:UDP-3-O-[3-hydroxymyristoyl] glucosamine N-acyltransferase
LRFHASVGGAGDDLKNPRNAARRPVLAASDSPSADLVETGARRYHPTPAGNHSFDWSKERAAMSTHATTLGQLAELVGGRIVGDPATAIKAAEVLSEVAVGEITFIDQPERLKQLAATQASAVLAPEKIAEAWLGSENAAARLPAIFVADVHAAFATIISHFRPSRTRAAVGIDPRAIISSSARCGNGVNLHPGATIGDDCQIGNGTTILPGAHIMSGCAIGQEVIIGPGVVLYENTIIGDRSILHGGVVVGAHGFGFTLVGGRYVPSAQLGYVRIGNDVEIGAGTTIDRGTYGATTIGDGTKIDNLVQIAHNCRIGKHNIICAQVGIAGSTSTGDYVVIGGQAGLRDHVHIGNGARLGAMAGITNDVPDGAAMLGIPATPEREQKLKLAALAKLPEMRQEFKAFRRDLAALQNIVGIGPKAHDSEQAA